MGSFVDKMKSICKENDISLSDLQYKQFEDYKVNLLDWNEKINLTAITEESEIIVKHFIDCLSCTFLIKENSKVIDIGTGAGFPGIPLKIFFGDELKVTLLDSLNKRINFLNDCIEKLFMKNIETFHGRAEDFGKDVNFREKYDICVSRAVANLKTLSEYALPFVKVGGYFLAMKGSNVNEEVDEAKMRISELGGEIEKIVDINLPMNINHSIVVIKKVKRTSSKFPRKSNEIKKENSKE